MANLPGIVLDFDGVIINSINECMLISFIAYYNLHINRELSLKIISKKNREIFKKFRYLVGPAYEYFYLWRSPESSQSMEGIESEFYQLREKYSPEADQFEKKFYQYRLVIQDRIKNEWIKLNPIYPNMNKEIRKLSKRKQVFISSTKDEQSIKLLCRSYNLPIRWNNIYGKEHGVEKLEHIRKIANSIAARPEQIIFIDDNLDHLMKVQYFGLRCHLAGWGYNTAKIRKEARKRGIEVIKRESLSEI